MLETKKVFAAVILKQVTCLEQNSFQLIPMAGFIFYYIRQSD
jgi:hypothetical protein